jgi:hypothetical protein
VTTDGHKVAILSFTLTIQIHHSTFSDMTCPRLCANDSVEWESPKRMKKGLTLLGAQYLIIDWTKSAMIQIMAKMGMKSQG